jgi:hypothetical protein
MYINFIYNYVTTLVMQYYNLLNFIITMQTFIITMVTKQN